MKILKLLLLFWTVALIFPTRAHAYLDLGTGSYITQIALATLLGGGLLLKNYWDRIKKFFGKKRDDDTNQG